MSNFDTVTIKKPKRSTFSLNHYVQDTYNIGDLNLLYARRCNPTDFVKMKWNTLIKFSPLLAPAFAHMRFKTYAFFVPTNQIDHTFEDMIVNTKKETITKIENGKLTTDSDSWKVPFVRPSQISCLMNFPTWTVQDSINKWWNESADLTFQNKVDIGRLCNQVGLPKVLTIPMFTEGISEVDPQFNWGPSVLQRSDINPKFKYIADLYELNLDDVHRGFPISRTLDEHYGNMFASLTENDSQIDLNIFKAYQHVWNEYFRDSRLQEKVDLYPDINGGYLDDCETIEDYFRFANNLLSIRRINYSKDYFNTAATDPTLGAQSLALPGNITALRKTNALQKFLEKRALGGSRFADFLLLHFGEESNNYDLNRPIYLGHSSQNVQISETLQTSQTTDGDDGSPQGTRTGNANSYGQSNGFAFKAPDYGYVIVVGALVPDIAYYQGINKKIVVDDWESFPFPEFANIGMQEIKHSEILNSFGNYLGDDNDTFGYQSRYIQWKHELDRVQGEFATDLAFWHQNPDFLRLRTEGYNVSKLNRFFPVVGFRPMERYNDMAEGNINKYYNRIFAVQGDITADHAQCQTYFDASVNTALPSSEMPSL